MAKIRITFDLNDRQMTVLGVKATNKMVRATREQAVSEIEQIVDEVLSAGTTELDKITAEVVAKLGTPVKS